MADTPNICDICKEPVILEFHADANIWHHVMDCKEPITGYDGGEGYACLECFTIKAAKMGYTAFMVKDITL